MSDVLKKITTGAIVVLYYPNWISCSSLLDYLQDQIDTIFVICNGISPEDKILLLDKVNQAPNQYLLSLNSENLGLGEALNIGLVQAQAHQIGYLFLFDQDSVVSNNYVQSMIDELEKISLKDSTAIAIGPSFFDLRAQLHIINKFKKNASPVQLQQIKEGVVACDCLITSGMLIDLKKIKPLQMFDASFFIDHVDSEWCFRMAAQGFQFYGSTQVMMGHHLSDARVIQIGPFTFLRYSPIRRYWFYKNSIRLIKLPYVSWQWKLRLAGILIISFVPNLFLDTNWTQSMRMMIKGSIDGLYY